MKAPTVMPIMITGYTARQSHYEVVGKLPIWSIILGPCGCGKTLLLHNMICDMDKGCFGRIYTFSLTIYFDSSWHPVKRYIEKEMKAKLADEEPIYFDHYDPDSFHEILDTQDNITQYTKNRGDKLMFQTRIIIDEFADDRAFTSQSKMLDTLYIRGCHNMTSTIIATLQLNASHPIVSVNAIELFVYRLRTWRILIPLLMRCTPWLIIIH